MSILEHLDSLRTKHARLERLIDEEAHRPMPDQIELHRLKKEKLKVKEELERLRGPEGQEMELSGHA